MSFRGNSVRAGSQVMLWFVDKVFLVLVAFTSLLPALVLALESIDFVLVGLCLAHVLLCVRLVSSECIFIKSVGYGAASAPLLLRQ